MLTTIYHGCCCCCGETQSRMWGWHVQITNLVLKSVVDRVSCGEGASCIQEHPSADKFYKLTCPSL